MKLHIGCGSVYLDGWTNLDNESWTCHLAEKRPDLVEKWRTTEDNYYGKHTDVGPDTVIAGPQVPETVCDLYGDICSLPVDNESVDEILCRQVFEHLSIREARQALAECNRVLKAGGILRLDVPDHWKTLEEYRDTGQLFFKRHLFGSRKSDSAWHVMGWNQNGLVAIGEQYGFIADAFEPNIHFYPAFCVRFKKMTTSWELLLRGGWIHAHGLSRLWKAAWEYCGDWWTRTPGTPLNVPRDWMCLEVGPGGHPWPGACAFIEPNPEFAAATHPKARVATVESLPDKMIRKGFDFVYCSHVLEHVVDPAAAIRGLEHTGKRGLIVCPSPMIETLFAYHEADHKWWVQNLGGKLVFQRTPEYVKELAVLDMQKAAHRLWRLGSPNLGLDGIHARKWYHLAEPFLETILWWEGTIQFEVIE